MRFHRVTPRRVLLALAGVATALLLAACGADGGEAGSEAASAPPPRSSGGAPGVTDVATGLDTPWEIAFLPDRRMLVTERAGTVRLIEADGRLRTEPLADVDVDAVGEGGLLGMALDPGFRDNGFVYLYRTSEEGNQVVRFRLDGDELAEEAVVVDGIPAGTIHNGGRIRFGPDERLYITTGDAGDPGLAQDPDSLGGKVLRLALADARGAGARPAVFTLGHRNSQGLDWDDDGRLIATEHGPIGNDEINVLREGRNYGWPEAEGADHGRFTGPVVLYEDAIAPSGATIAREGPWAGELLVGALAGTQIRRVRLDGDRAEIDRAILDGDVGRVRTVAQDPRGNLYALTSNRDGRGSPSEDDDRVVRIVPPPEG